MRDGQTLVEVKIPRLKGSLGYLPGSKRKSVKNKEDKCIDTRGTSHDYYSCVSISLIRNWDCILVFPHDFVF